MIYQILYKSKTQPNADWQHWRPTKMMPKIYRSKRAVGSALAQIKNSTVWDPFNRLYNKRSNDFTFKIQASNEDWEDLD